MIDNATCLIHIMGGDFNLVLDVEMDKFRGKKCTNKMSNEVIKQKIKADNLVDVWRDKNPEEKFYTWFRAKPEPAMTRLDFFLLHHVLVPLVSATDIVENTFSDHSMITMYIQLEENHKGPGFWRLNTSLLTDETYIERVSEVIQDVLGQQFKDIRAKWNFLKLKFKEFSIQYSARKKKARDNLLSALERKMRQVQERISDHSFLSRGTILDEINQLNVIKQEIREIEEFKVRGAMIRSRADWFQFGEKLSKYFFRLEQSNFARKNRFRIINGTGEIVLTQAGILKVQGDYYKKLFAYQPVDENPNYLKGLNAPSISILQKEELDSPITLDEINKARKNIHEV